MSEFSSCETWTLSFQIINEPHGFNWGGFFLGDRDNGIVVLNLDYLTDFLRKPARIKQVREAIPGILEFVIHLMYQNFGW